ncbi:MarR family transcriptional regulator [Herbaspirillum sp. LeCh32-8]|uniref:MarR family winged helix-turn-helix transcriptional regulator n=1 Tax=Herbaspirillum sp. LeCh32-8 TaxID=2821356 RepID=UPI001AEAC51B|nr:MarR family transcriptional regulator [Herbaspirillum sp. LeCh32-8]MBP0596534.1 MarR family transcriptional regulator [Herbaspirillum sp. LeCh32-8]
MSTSFTNDYTEAADALRNFYLRSHRALDKLLAAQGASFSRTKLMAYIGNNAPVRSTDLAEAFGFAPRTVTEAVDGMERDGLVERVADPADRRVKQISLTELGKEVLCSTEPARKRFGERLFDALDQEETYQLALLLNKLNGRLAELEEELSQPAQAASNDAGGKRGKK